MRTDLMNIEDAVDGHEGSKHDQSKPTEAEEAERLGAAFGAIAGLVPQAPAPRCGHAQAHFPRGVACALDSGHQGYHRGDGFAWCCPGEATPETQAENLTHYAGCERHIYEVCAASDAPPAVLPPPARVAAPAPAASPEGAEPLTMDRLIRVAVQATMREPVDAPLLTWAMEGTAAARALLTPGGRLQLIADLGQGLSPEDCRAAARAFLAALPPGDGESALAQALRVCGDVAVDDLHAGALDAVPVGVEAARELLEDPARALAVAAELAALLPSGPPGARLLLGVSAEARAFIAALPGADSWVTPHVMDGRVVTIPGARVVLGGLVVEAQGEAQPVELPGAAS